MCKAEDISHSSPKNKHSPGSKRSKAKRLSPTYVDSIVRQMMESGNAKPDDAGHGNQARPTSLFVEMAYNRRGFKESPPEKRMRTNDSENSAVRSA